MITRRIGQLLDPMWSNDYYDIAELLGTMRYNEYYFERVDLYNVAISGAFIDEHVYGVA